MTRLYACICTEFMRLNQGIHIKVFPQILQHFITCCFSSKLHPGAAGFLEHGNQFFCHKCRIKKTRPPYLYLTVYNFPANGNSMANRVVENIIDEEYVVNPIV